MKLQALQREIEEHQPPATHGLMLGLWVADVVFAAEYWAVRAVRGTLSAMRWAGRHRLAIAAATFIGGLALGARTAAISHDVQRTAAAQVGTADLANRAAYFRLETGKLASSPQQLVPRYLSEVRIDPWGRAYALFQGAAGVAAVSAGPDGLFGTGDDIVSIESIYDLRK